MPLSREPFVVALCATRGRRPELLANCLACFCDQTYEHCRLLLLDDYGNIQNQQGERWQLVSTMHRYPSMPAKYRALVELANTLWPTTEAYQIWDDDDAFSSLLIEENVRAIQEQNKQWAYPEHILSAYHSPPKMEPTGGRFWSSMLFTRWVYNRIGGFNYQANSTFDQVFLRRLADYGPPARPRYPLYTYRWQTAACHHASGIPDGPQWYANQQPQYTSPIGRLTPQYDQETPRLKHQMNALLTELAGYVPKAPSVEFTGEEPTAASIHPPVDPACRYATSPD